MLVAQAAALAADRRARDNAWCPCSQVLRGSTAKGAVCTMGSACTSCSVPHVCYVWLVGDGTESIGRPIAGTSNSEVVDLTTDEPPAFVSGHTDIVDLTMFDDDDDDQPVSLQR